jgi:uncharacterized membrane protein YeaQ/YmgE (transglycosylase-associated protein family)
MGILAWIILGGIAGWIASKIMKTDHEQGIVGNVVVGIIGGLLGGFIMNFFGGSDVSGFNLYSLLVAVGGACVALWIYKMVSGDRRKK